MSREGAATHAGPRARMVTKSIYFFVFVERTNKRHHHHVPQWGASLAGQWLHTAADRDGTWVARTGSEPMLMCGDIFAAFPVADDWASAFQPSCCCWQGTWPGRLCWQDGRLLGPVPEAAHSPQPAVCLNTTVLRRQWPPSLVAGAGARLKQMPHCLWQTVIGGHPRRRPPQRRASPVPFFLADCEGLSVGWVS